MSGPRVDPLGEGASWSELHLLQDPDTGLRAVVAIDDRSLGPPRGGTRLRRYPDLAAAVADASRLARAMTLKFAVHGLPYGGGKAVILQDDDGERDRPLLERRLRAYGRFLERVGACCEFGTGPDMGCGPREVAVVQQVTGRMVHAEGLEEATLATSAGARVALELGLREVLGTGLAGRRIAVQGVGAVGAPLARDLVARGALVVLADADEARARELADELGPSATVVPAADVLEAEVDALAPCAAGGVLTAQLVPRLRCRVIAGAANNQLADPEEELADALAARGVLFVPDPVVSGGAAIVLTGCSAGAAGVPLAVAEARIAATVEDVLRRAARAGTTPHAAARSLARERLAQARAALPVERSGAVL